MRRRMCGGGATTMAKTCAWVASLVGLGWVGGCNASDADAGGSGGGSLAVCEQAVSTLRGCGLLSEGDADCDDVDEDSACFIRCYLDASCDVIEQTLCADIDTSPLAPCIDACDRATPRRACDDGTEYPVDYGCDFIEDCESGEDEANCDDVPAFVCGDGTKYPVDYECDGYPDCLDASDEQGCGQIAELLCSSL